MMSRRRRRRSVIIISANRTPPDSSVSDTLCGSTTAIRLKFVSFPLTDSGDRFQLKDASISVLNSDEEESSLSAGRFQ